jgi:type VI secretion system secreted protein VgrG
MGTYTQANRLLSVTTPLGADVLLLNGFSGHEEMSRLFGYQLDMLSENCNIAAKDIVGKSVSWKVQPTGGTARIFSGMVARFSAGPQIMQGLRSYCAEIVPWLWFLTLTTDCRIFQNKNASDIVQQIFKELGFNDFQVSLRSTPPVMEYCVQYRETDFNFVSRLLEENGIFYFFKHAQGKHTLVLTDQKSGYVDCVEKEIDYSSGSLAPHHISSWDHQYAFRSGKWAQTDYNFETPSTSLLTNSTTVVSLPGNTAYEKFDYPGRYGKTADTKTNVRMEEEEVGYDVVEASSTCSTFTPGGKFTLKTHESASEKKDYVISAIHHSAQDDSYTNTAGLTQAYRNSFTCIPASVVFRPARTTPKPLVPGPQTAVVVGKAGEEIYVDKYGRVKVQFFWDRLGKNDENSSCWIRVAQGLAGKGWGMVFHPRIGHEVVVDFLEGDPDRPLITGCVYNANMMPPYDLPANMTQHVIKTRSSKGGGTADFNELRLEDKMGSEDIYFHAQKDFHRVVENDDDLKVGHDQTIQVKNNRTEEVTEGDEAVTIKKGKRTHTVQADETLEVKQGNRSVLVDQGNDSHEVKQGNRSVKISMGNDALTISMGNQTTKLDLGKSSTNAMQGIELVCGQSSVKIDQMGVTIKGMMISVEGQVQTEVKGLMTSVKGDAMTQISGGITMIG